MDITFHAHRAVITTSVRLRARQLVTSLAEKVRRPVDATVRVEPDGPGRRVEIVLHAPRRRPLVGTGHGRTAGPALSEAAANVASQIGKAKRKRRVKPKAGV